AMRRRRWAGLSAASGISGTVKVLKGLLLSSEGRPRRGIRGSWVRRAGLRPAFRAGRTRLKIGGRCGEEAGRGSGETVAGRKWTSSPPNTLEHEEKGMRPAWPRAAPLIRSADDPVRLELCRDLAVLVGRVHLHRHDTLPEVHPEPPVAVATSF